jgi:hypothetical protein
MSPARSRRVARLDASEPISANDKWVCALREPRPNTEELSPAHVVIRLRDPRPRNGSRGDIAVTRTLADRLRLSSPPCPGGWVADDAIGEKFDYRCFCQIGVGKDPQRAFAQPLQRADLSRGR